MVSTIVYMFAIIVTTIIIIINDNHYCQHHYPARALRALGLLLADGNPTVGGGKTFRRLSRIFLWKQQ